MTATPATRVMIVEDEALISLMLESVLEESGFEVVGIADEFADAIALFERTQPDLVVMAVCILGDRDGIETAAALRERRPVPIIFLTAYTDPLTLAGIRDVGAYDVMSKPLEGSALREMVWSALAAPLEHG